MDLCSQGHDEICYTSKKCPACNILEEVEELKEKIEDLEDEIKEM